MKDKFQYYNGLKFTRDDKTGYYLNSTLRIRMHRYVWVCEKGDIPKGYDVHHIDHDRSNNDISNLELLTMHEHRKQHWEEKSAEEKQWFKDNMENKARPAAIAWHKSEEGRKWHREMVNKAVAEGKLGGKRYTCICKQCGKEFKSGSKNGKWCSGACAAKYRRDNHLDDVKKICAVCGKEFLTSKFGNTIACSRSCGNVLRSKAFKENVVISIDIRANESYNNSVQI